MSYQQRANDSMNSAKQYSSSAGAVHNSDEPFSSSGAPQNRNFDTSYTSEIPSNSSRAANDMGADIGSGDPYAGMTSDTKKGFNSVESRKKEQSDVRGGDTSYSRKHDDSSYSSSKYSTGGNDSYSSGGRNEDYSTSGGSYTTDPSRTDDTASYGQSQYNQSRKTTQGGDYGEDYSQSYPTDTYGSRQKATPSDTVGGGAYDYSSSGSHTHGGSHGTEYRGGSYGNDNTANKTRGAVSSAGYSGEGYGKGTYATDTTAEANRRAATGTRNARTTAQRNAQLAEDEHVSMGDKMKGNMEKMAGKLTRDPELVQKGEDLKTGHHSERY